MPDPTATVVHSAYCPVCDGRFAPAAACPGCGTTMPTDDRSDIADGKLGGKPVTNPEGDEAAATVMFTEEGVAAGETPAVTAADDWHGFDARLGQRLHVYDLQHLLGAGGMGRVFLARHGGLGRRCAVKVLSPKATQKDVNYIDRFRLEGEAAASLNHENVVVTHAIGEDRAFHFLEMEYVPGGSLRRLVETEGPLSPLRATHLTARVADGLAAAHRRGIIHRDLKADNVMLTLGGVPKLGDFGLAKRVLSEDGLDGRYLVGTPPYMAPELFDGRPASPASDVYALGVMYFLLLTGQLPFEAESLTRLIVRVRNEPPPNARRIVPDLPLEMAECLSMLLEKCPTNRPADGAAAAQLLMAVAGQSRDLESLLREAFAGRPDVTWTRTGSEYRLRIALPEGRRQFVTVEPSRHAAAERLLLISSVCGPADPDYYEAALRLNAEISHGSLTISDCGGVPMFCATDTYPRAGVTPDAIRRSVLELARRADGLERLLTGGDSH